MFHQTRSKRKVLVENEPKTEWISKVRLMHSLAMRINFPIKPTRQLLVVIYLLSFLVTACIDTTNPGILTTTEEEQIKATVKDYFRRDPDLPEYIADVEEVDGYWARVSLSAEGITSTDGKMMLYLQDQANTLDPAPTAALQVTQLQNNAEVQTDTRWIIITPPQVNFTDEELDAASVPEQIRPS